MSVLGTSVRRIEDPRLLRGEGQYVDSLTDPLLDGSVRAHFVRSFLAHGQILGIDTSEALSMPGVTAVFTSADVDLVPAAPGGAGAPESMARPWLPAERVRFVGEPVAMVLAETSAQAADAAEMVFVDVDPLDPVVGIVAGLSDETLLFPAAGTNRNSRMDGGWDRFGPDRADDDSPLFEGCDLVVRRTIINQRLAGVSIEGRASAAVFLDGHLTQWISSQHAHGARSQIARAHGLSEEQLRVIVGDVGGGFGPKINPSPEDVLVGWAAGKVGRPVRWAETRSENLTSQSQGRAQLQHVAIGGTRDGRVLAFELDIRQDSGAYPLLGSSLPFFTRRMAGGPYDIERIRTRAESVVTNTVPIEAYRGAGRPEATAAIERAMDLFALEIDMDPAEVRRRNLIPAFDEPFKTDSGAVYDCGDFDSALRAVLAASDYEDWREKQRFRRENQWRRVLGVGVCTYVEITGSGPATEFARVVVTAGDDGSVTAELFTGASPHGQGLHTALAMIASETLGIPIGQIRVSHGDTSTVPSGGGTMGSRSLQMGGSAIRGAARDVLAMAKQAAAEELEAPIDDIEVCEDPPGLFRADTPERIVPWARILELASDAGLTESDTALPTLSVEDVYSTDGATYPFGAHVAVVEVDLDTGEVVLLKLFAGDDAGRILNPMLAEGQRHGGIAQGVSQALFESVLYDDQGNPITSTLADYAVPSAADLPDWDLVAMETPTPMNPLGAKGIGESGTIGSTPAVQSAVVDAVSHLGIDHMDMPLTSFRVWSALADPRSDISRKG